VSNFPETIQYQAADDILNVLGVNPTAVNVNLLVAWMQQEYSAADLAVTNNPLATSLRTTEAGGYCTLPGGEQSSDPCHDTLADGAPACAKTLVNGLYPHLLAGLEDSDTGTFFSAAGVSELGMWVSGTYGGHSYASELQTTYNSLPAPPAWALASSLSPVTSPPPPPSYLGWLGAGLFFVGVAGAIALAVTKTYPKPAAAFAHYKPHTDTAANMTARMRPEYMTFMKPTEAEAHEVLAKPDPCTVYNRIKDALVARGVRVTEPRNLPPGIEAYFDPDDGPDGNVMLSPAIAQGCDTCSPHCDPYSTQIIGHEGAHSLLQNTACMPKLRDGMPYASVGHLVEEAEADLSALVFMTNIGLPVQMYDGSVIPPGSVEADWQLAQKVLDPVTLANVRWASGWLTRAAQGVDTASLNAERCPLYNP
jgi:hypothetical protein